MKNIGILGFKQKALEVHGNKFDYSKSLYINSKTPLTIICPFHGEFLQSPYVHLKTHGCPKCGRHYTEKSHIQNYEEFIKKCNKKFNNKYTYSFKGSNFKAQTSVLNIKCSCNNCFSLKARNHLFSKAGGCKKCQYTLNFKNNKKPLEHAKTLLNKHFPNLKIIDDSYITMSRKCKVICQKHGVYETKPYNFQYGHGGCPNCAYPSNIEKIIQNFLDFNNIKYKKNDRDIIKPNEIDFVIGDVGLELCGLYWHSDANIDNDYHYKKYLKCLSENIKLLQFFEDEIIDKKEIVFSMILNRLGKIEKKYARNCTIKEISNKEKKQFLNKNHLQGDCISKINLGLILNNEIISVMTFGKQRINLGKKISNDNDYELIRFANKINTTTVGGASKLFSYFIKKYNPKKIISYCDLRYSTGNLYKKLGFKYDKISKPNYFYFKSGYGLKRYNRFSFRKSVLHKLLEKFDPEKTEKQNMIDNKFLRIYDCGCMKFEWNDKL